MSTYFRKLPMVFVGLPKANIGGNGQHLKLNLSRKIHNPHCGPFHDRPFVFLSIPAKGPLFSKIFLPLLPLLPLFQTFFEPFVGKSDKTGSHFYHFEIGCVKVAKVAKITTYQNFPGNIFQRNPKLYA